MGEWEGGRGRSGEKERRAREGQGRRLAHTSSRHAYTLLILFCLICIHTLLSHSPLYSLMPSRYKKNLKKLYIVHPSRFIKVLMTLFKPVIR